MYAVALIPALGAAVAMAQGQGAGYPPPPPMTLSTTLSGVLPVLPTQTPGFSGVETEEGAIVYDGPANPSFMPVNGPATTAANLPAATYMAMLPSTNFDNGTGSTIMGSVMISSTAGGSGVSVSVNFTGFPSESLYGPFVYHIHEFPVPANGNCSATVGHLDPTDRGEYYPCNVGAPATCQVGDLAGKHGNVTMPNFVAQYTDAFLSTDPSSTAFFGDKSIVIHSSNTTRLTCANFKMMGGAANGTSSTNSSSPTPSSSVTPYTGAGSKMSGYGFAAFMAATVWLL
ncbi:hypothetical protein LTR78_007030 [Recurvomyces mirabilis]|uniref:superoxide dismutase n=1 Tax=Recurvomyces mirabilis TaxID=574656 RepID=A0AAE1BZ49_9PEZI|nr:hypothetical protein LTR78_007030 [Recurvomyces mirabilis]KAK5153414.1 Cell surface superoxide dismutase [Cu-Zn] 4 [Recurvomyces mirabilis]